MTVKILGQVLSIRNGVSKTSGKPYTVTDVYDGYGVTRVYNAPPIYAPGEQVEIKAFIRVDEKGRLFCMASKEQ